MDKDLKKVIQAIVKAGYVVVVNKNGHLVIYTQDGERLRPSREPRVTSAACGTLWPRSSVAGSAGPLGGE